MEHKKSLIGIGLSIREVFVVGSWTKSGFLVLCMWVGLEGMWSFRWWGTLAVAI